MPRCHFHKFTSNLALFIFKSFSFMTTHSDFLALSTADNRCSTLNWDVLGAASGGVHVGEVCDFACAVGPIVLIFASRATICVAVGR